MYVFVYKMKSMWLATLLFLCFVKIENASPAKGKAVSELLFFFPTSHSGADPEFISGWGRTERDKEGSLQALVLNPIVIIYIRLDTLLKS